jgi:hypothetical protein
VKFYPESPSAGGGTVHHGSHQPAVGREWGLGLVSRTFRAWLMGSTRLNPPPQRWEELILVCRPSYSDILVAAKATIWDPPIRVEIKLVPPIMRLPWRKFGVWDCRGRLSGRGNVIVQCSFNPGSEKMGQPVVIGYDVDHPNPAPGWQITSVPTFQHAL